MGGSAREAASAIAQMGYLHVCTIHTLVVSSAIVDIRAMTPEDEIDYGGGVLETRLSAAIRDPGVSAETIRQLVCALVDKMKAGGAPPEKVLLAVKRALRGDGEVIAVGAKRTPQMTNQEFVQQAVTWCIKRYYADST
jgi:hypothetical protein